MKQYVHYVTAFLAVVTCLAFGALHVQAQGGVFNPSDPVVNYDAAHPPAKPALGQVGKWVRTPRLSWSTTSYKCYLYNYSNNGSSAPIAFRLKYPKNYDSTKQYPVLIFFHGDGEYGSIYDNEYQLYHGGQAHMNAVDKGTFNGFLLYPQNANSTTDPPGLWSTTNRAAINALMEKVMIPLKMVDPFRIYVDGLSAGGGSGWSFLRAYPKLVAAFTPISAASTSYADATSLQKYRFTPIYHFQGGLDDNPAPSTSHKLGKMILAVGGNYKYKEFPDRGHDCWNQAWAQTDYFPFYTQAHKANPWPLYGRTEFCQGEVFKDTLGVTPGFDGYEWRKNGVLISGANANYIVATDYGTYDCRIKRGTDWSVWSPQPVVISVKAPTVQPMIMVAGGGSNVIPKPDGSSSVSLQVPDGYTSYSWQLEGSSTVLSTTSSLSASTVGNYKVKITEPYGCPAPAGAGLSARVQAEDFINMSGVTVETTTDVDGNQNVASINKYDWMEYKINVPTTGSYSVKLRLASPSTGGQLKIFKADGTTVLATVSVPNTGSYFVYKNATTTINLTAGLQIIRMQSTASPLWNINWFDLTDPRTTDASGYSMRFPVINASSSNAPPAVTSLAAQALSKTAIKVTWNQTSSPTYNETGFEIYSATASSGPYTYQVTTAPDASNYTFNNLASGTTFYYKVRAINNNGASATAGPASATTLVDNVAPTTPLNLRLGTITKYSVGLLWDKSTDDVGVTQYDVYVNGVKMYVVGGTSSSTTVYNLVPNTSYTFTLQARDAARNTSAFSNSVSAKTLTGTLKQDPSMSALPGNYSVYVNMNIDNPAPAPWVNTNALPTQGQTVKNMKDYAGYASGATLTIVDNFSGYNPGGMNTGNNSGVYPDNVMRSMYYCDKGVVAKLQISGLSLKHKYSFVFFGSRNGTGDRTSVYTIGSQSVSLNASMNTTTTVQIDNIVPDENGSVFIQVALSSTAMYAYLNSLVIKGYAQTTTAAVTTSTTTPTATQSSTLSTASVYPNPVQTDATLAVPLTQSVSQLSVQLTDAAGSVISTQTYRNVPQGTWTQRLPLTGKASQPGIYFIHITGLPEGKSQVLKLVKAE